MDTSGVRLGVAQKSAEVLTNSQTIRSRESSFFLTAESLRGASFHRRTGYISMSCFCFRCVGLRSAQPVEVAPPHSTYVLEEFEEMVLIDEIFPRIGQSLRFSQNLGDAIKLDY